MGTMKDLAGAYFRGLMIKVVVLLAFVGAIALCGVMSGFAAADQVPAVTVAQTCDTLLPGGVKTDIDGSHPTLVISAPAGKVFDQVCVKAGSANQGLGAEFFAGCSGLSTCTISHSSGKDISHWSYTAKVVTTPPPRPQNLNLTFMQPCQPAEGQPPVTMARWRVRNPNAFAVDYAVDKAGTGQILSGTAPAGDSFFETPWGAQTLILKWSSGSNTKAGGNTYNGTVCPLPDPVCHDETALNYGEVGECKYDDTPPPLPTPTPPPPVSCEPITHMWYQCNTGNWTWSGPSGSKCWCQGLNGHRVTQESYDCGATWTTWFDGERTKVDYSWLGFYPGEVCPIGGC
jgi:hypothetical protein